MPVGTGLGVVIDGGGCHVHQQHRECHGIRIAPPGADDIDDYADRRAIDELALFRGTGGDRIGGDEEGSEDRTAAEYMELREGVAFRIEKPEHGCHQDQARQEGQRNMPGDGSFVEHPESAQ